MTLRLTSDPSWDAERASVENLFVNIAKKYGKFEDLTEDSLRLELENERKDITVDTREFTLSKFLEPVDDEEPPIDIVETKGKVLEQLAQTQQALLQAKDLVALILAGQGSKPVELSLSPFIKQSVPLNSVKLLSVEPRALDDTQKQSTEQSGFGSKLEALDSAASKLLGAANNAETELAKEDAYWNAFQKIKAGGWPILKDPTQRSRLCVKYGLGDAAPEFRDQVHSTVLVDNDNETTLDTIREHDSRLSARILSKGSCIATSSLKTDSTTRSEDIIDDLRNARDSIFDEELLFELQREAREYPARGIKYFEKRIEFQLQEDITAVVQLEDDHESQVLDIDMDNDLRATYATVPDLILVYLRIMLTRAHDETRQQRTAEPAPLTERSKPRATHSLLGPLLGQIEFKRISARVDELVRAVQRLSLAAKIGITIQREGAKITSDLPASKLGPAHGSEDINRQNWIYRLFVRTESSLTIESGLTGSKIILSYRLSHELASYKIDLQTDAKHTIFGDTLRTTITPNFEHVSRVIHHLLKLDTLQNIVDILKPQGWEVLNRIEGLVQAPKKLGSRTLRVDVDASKITLELDASSYRMIQIFEPDETYETGLIEMVRLWGAESLDVEQIETST